MAKGLSIHIGVSYVDRNKFGSDNFLGNTGNDALAMKEIAAQNGYDWLILINEKARRDVLLTAIDLAAKTLVSGDIFFLSFSGHGYSVKDTNGDEEDGYDEGWVLYDSKILDDDLYLMWKKFKKGVRIIVISDSCYSGSVTKPGDFDKELLYNDYERKNPNSLWGKKWDYLVSQQNYLLNETKNTLSASVLLLSACSDKEFASGTNDNNIPLSLFTYTLLKVWDDGSFNGNYRTFYNEIKWRTPHYYNPEYYYLGPENEAFQRQKPFYIGLMRKSVLCI